MFSGHNSSNSTLPVELSNYMHFNLEPQFKSYEHMRILWPDCNVEWLDQTKNKLHYVSTFTLEGHMVKKMWDEHLKPTYPLLWKIFDIVHGLNGSDSETERIFSLVSKVRL